jgi:hypothetical protein
MRPLKKGKPNGYRETIDGLPPRMNPNHVDFVRFCVEELKKESLLTQAMLVHKYIEANPDGDT